MKIADQLFRWVLVAVACGFLYLLWQRRDIGRFTLHEDGQTIKIMDSKTGNIRMFGMAEGRGAWVELNPTSGTAAVQLLLDPKQKTSK